MKLFKRKRAENTLDDENGNCRQCGHSFDEHIVVAYDVSDFSKGGEMTCPVPGCDCYHTISFNLDPGADKHPNGLKRV